MLVKKPEQLDEIDGLVIPGGESGTFLKLLGEAGFEKLKDFVHSKPTFGTCAGRSCWPRDRNPKQAGLAPSTLASAAMPTAARSTARFAKAGFPSGPMEMVFIRAPKIAEDVGPGVEVIAREGNDPVAVRHGKTMAATFHPELSDDTRIHRAFLDLVQNGH